MAAVLVTGAAGFVGGHLLEALLDAGHRVVGLDNFDPFYSRAMKEAHLREGRAPEATLVELDVLDSGAVQALLASARVEAVVHLAARAGVRPSLADPMGYVRANVLGTASLLQACQHAGVSRIVFASSSSVYGERCEGPFQEGDGDLGVDRPASPYAATKRCGELLVRTHAELNRGRAVCLRLFTVYGPWQRPDLAIHRFASQILSGEPVTVFGDGSMRRDFTYVADTVAGILAALEWTEAASAPAFEVLNLGCGRPVTVLEVIRALEKSLSRAARLRFTPRPPGEVSLTHADCSKAATTLGYSPRVCLEDGIDRFAAWMRAAPAG